VCVCVFGLDSFGSRYGPVIGSWEHGDEPSGSIKGGERLEYLSDYQLVMRGGALLHGVTQIPARRHSTWTAPNTGIAGSDPATGMYVCMHACMYVCMYVCVYICMTTFYLRCVVL
jgi:hypothetical protein